jgi:small subunit ribosomal protein S1
MVNPSEERGGPADPDSFAALFEASLEEHEKIKEGEIVHGTVVRVGRDHVVVDIGYKSEGVIQLSEFADTSGQVNVKAGDKIDVLLESREDEMGLVILSKEKADKMKVWDEISAACERDELIEGTISLRVKGGLSVTIKGGVKAFLPGSQVDLRPIRNLDKLIGQTFQFKVIKFNKKRGNIVLSRRVLLERERDELKAKTLEKLQEGMIVEGIVKNITEYGAFVDLGGIDGLLHITDMSWGRVGHPSELFNVGDTVQVKVLKYNAETERVSLGLKQCQEDPWNHAEEAYPAGKRVRGKVVSLTDYGAFVELEQGVEGLIHISEMSWTKKIKHPSKLLNVGDEVECAVLDVDSKAKRISLGLKQLEPDPWTLFTQKYRPGDKVEGLVRSLTDYGVFVGIEEGVDGMVHKSDISWTQRVNHPSELFQKDDKVEAIILNINHDEKKVSLGIKQLYDDPWERIPKEYPIGRTLEVKVMKVTDFGAFVELEKGIEGLIHVSELRDERVDDPRTVVNEGDVVKAEIITVDTAERRIGLSMKSAQSRAEMGDAREYLASQQPTKRSGTLGDLIQSKLGDKVADLPPGPGAPPKPTTRENDTE